MTSKVPLYPYDKISKSSAKDDVESIRLVAEGTMIIFHTRLSFPISISRGVIRLGRRFRRKQKAYAGSILCEQLRAMSRTQNTRNGELGALARIFRKIALLRFGLMLYAKVNLDVLPTKLGGFYPSKMMGKLQPAQLSLQMHNNILLRVIF
jgi:hypothetical protein